MRRARRGAALGAIVGAAMFSVPVLGWVSLHIDDYEIGDPLVFMGVPLLVIATAVGALIGSLRSSPPQSSDARTSSGWPLALLAAVVGLAWLVVLAKSTSLINWLIW